MRAAPPTPSRREPDWRDQSACRDQDPELFFTGTDEAKTLCARCPVTSQCLDLALETRSTDGVFGGLDEDERKNLNRRTHRNTQAPRGPKQLRPASMRDLFDRHTNPAADGHLMWTGSKTPEFRNRQLTANQLSYLIDRGYEWNGSIHRLCDVRGCVQPLHLADTAERHQRAAATKTAV